MLLMERDKTMVVCDKCGKKLDLTYMLKKWIENSMEGWEAKSWEHYCPDCK